MASLFQEHREVQEVLVASSFLEDLEAVASSSLVDLVAVASFQEHREVQAEVEGDPLQVVLEEGEEVQFLAVLEEVVVIPFQDEMAEVAIPSQEGMVEVVIPNQVVQEVEEANPLLEEEVEVVNS